MRTPVITLTGTTAGQFFEALLLGGPDLRYYNREAVCTAHPTTAATLMWWVKVFGVPPSGGPGPRKRGTPNGYRLCADHQIRVAGVPRVAEDGLTDDGHAAKVGEERYVAGGAAGAA